MINQQTVEKIAKLARLKLSAADLEKYTGQLNSILGFVEKLNQLDTSNIEATTHAVEVPTPFREDKMEVKEIIQKVLEISPDHEEKFFRVPKVL